MMDLFESQGLCQISSYIACVFLLIEITLHQGHATGGAAGAFPGGGPGNPAAPRGAPGCAQGAPGGSARERMGALKLRGRELRVH